MSGLWVIYECLAYHVSWIIEIAFYDFSPFYNPLILHLISQFVTSLGYWPRRNFMIYVHTKDVEFLSFVKNGNVRGAQTFKDMHRL